MRRADNGPSDAFTVGELCERTGKEARVGARGAGGVEAGRAVAAGDGEAAATG
jgi:hypothetical protein